MADDASSMMMSVTDTDADRRQLEETACETPMLTSKGISSFFKRGGYPLPVNSVILNTSIESAYPGAKKSIKNDWKCGR